MMKKLLPLIVLLLSVHLVPPVLAAQSKADACQDKINKAVATETRTYRAHLFGVQPAHMSPVGDIRYHFITGLPWIKKKENEWIDSEGNTATDDEIDQQSENSNLLGTDSNGNRTPRRGIFATKRVLTSELIPYLSQNIRALSCNIDRICKQARFSMSLPDDSPTPIDSIQPLGCIEFTNLVSFPECQIQEGEILDQASILTYCAEIGNQLLSREAALLKLAVEYDAGYRSALQFAGMFDTFLGELRWSFTGSIRQAASLIGQLNRIPCFLSSCDESPE